MGVPLLKSSTALEGFSDFYVGKIHNPESFFFFPLSPH